MYLLTHKTPTLQPKPPFKAGSGRHVSSSIKAPPATRAARNMRVEHNPKGTKRVEPSISAALNNTPPVVRSNDLAHFHKGTKDTFVAVGEAV